MASGGQCASGGCDGNGGQGDCGETLNENGKVGNRVSTAADRREALPPRIGSTDGCGSGECAGRSEGDLGGCGRNSNGMIVSDSDGSGKGNTTTTTAGIGNGRSTFAMCTKCKRARAMVYMESGGRCFECLKEYLSRLFRFALGRANASGPAARLAVAVSGGYSSATVAHLAYHYLESIQRKPGELSPPVLLYHIRADEAASAAVTKLAESIPRSRLRIIDNDTSSNRPQLTDRNDEMLLCDVEMRKKLAAAITTDGDYHLLFGTNATRNSAKILEAIVHGRPGVAGTIGIEPVAAVRGRLLYRYARHHLATFAAEYMSGNYQHLQSPFLQAISRFIIRAEADNSSAVHNVVNTVSKLTTPPIECKLCSAPSAKEEDEDNEDRNENNNIDNITEICSPCRQVLKRAQKRSGAQHGELIDFIRRGAEGL